MRKSSIIKVVLHILLLLILYYFLEIISVFLFLTIYCFSTNINPYWLDASIINSNYFMIDSFACFMSILVYLFIYSHKKYNKNTDIVISPNNIIKYSLVTMGMGGISTLWFIFANKLLVSIPFIQNSLQNFLMTSKKLNNESYLFVLFSVIILGPIVEELLFRGLIFNELAKYRNGLFPIIISGLLFGLFHREPVQVVYATLLGFILGFVYSKTNSLPVVIFMHILNNLLSTLPPQLATTRITTIISLLQIICIIPMIYILYKLHNKDIISKKV